MKIVTGILILTAFTNVAYTQQKINEPKNAIGHTYKNISELSQFAGYKEQRGVMLEPTDDDFGLSVIANKTHTIIVFNKITTAGKMVDNHLLDLVDLGNINKAETILIATCKVSNKNDSEVFALAEHGVKGNYKTVLKAWRANKKTGKIESIPVNRISCIDDDYTETD